MGISLSENQVSVMHNMSISRSCIRSIIISVLSLTDCMFRVANFNNLLWSEVSGCRWFLEGVVCSVYLGQYTIGDNELLIGKEILLGKRNLFCNDEGGGGDTVMGIIVDDCSMVYERARREVSQFDVIVVWEL